VGKLATLGVCTGLICLAAATRTDATPRGRFLAPGGAPHAPEIMLYFSHSVGGGAGAGTVRPTFGLRVQQVHQAANSGDPEQGSPMQHRELINWQMEGRPGLRLSDMRVKLGGRLTYDLSTRRFGAPSSRPAIPLGTASLRNSTPNFAPPSAISARPPAPRETNKDNSNMREIAVAAVAALAPARFTPVQRQMTQRTQLSRASSSASH
jgi:hypothetical protein